jgi:hypothetical protein
MSDRYEFWAFRHRPCVLKGERLIFTFDGKPVAEAICDSIEAPGKSKCHSTGKYEDYWKAFWLSSSFKKYKIATMTYDAVQQHPDFPRIEELLNQVFPHLTGARRQQKAMELMEQHIRNNEALKHVAAKAITMYHGTREPFTKIDMSKGAQGVFWLTSDLDSLKSGERGASSTKVILRCLVTIKNPAGWDEYEKRSLGELKRMGFDGVILPDPDGSFDAVVFKPNQVKIVGQEEITKTATYSEQGWLTPAGEFLPITSKTENHKGIARQYGFKGYDDAYAAGWVRTSQDTGEDYHLETTKSFEEVEKLITRFIKKHIHAGDTVFLETGEGATFESFYWDSEKKRFIDEYNNRDFFKSAGLDEKAVNIPLTSLIPDEHGRDPRLIANLVEKIKNSGRIDPLEVREMGDGTFFIEDGTHRYYAAQKLGITALPAHIWRKSASGRGEAWRGAADQTESPDARRDWYLEMLDRSIGEARKKLQLEHDPVEQSRLAESIRTYEILKENMESTGILNPFKNALLLKSAATLWHGGKIYGPIEIQPPSKGRYEAGPGLYLTTSYWRAQSYAKGSKSTYLVTIKDNLNWADKVEIPLAEGVEFALRYLGKGKLIAKDLKANCERMKKDTFTADIIINLTVNYEAGSGKKGMYLLRFLVEHGVDAALENQGSGEQWVVVFNPRVVTNVKQVPAKEVNKEMWEMPKVGKVAKNPDVASLTFKTWFGNSKVVDDKGRPLPVYHGTKADFDTFDLGMAGTNNDPGMWGTGFYFSPQKRMSRGYGDKFKRVYLSLQNPLIFGDEHGRLPDELNTPWNPNDPLASRPG